MEGQSLFRNVLRSYVTYLETPDIHVWILAWGEIA